MLDFSAHVNGPAPLPRPGPGNGGISSDATFTLPRFTFCEWQALCRAMMRDKSYLLTALGSDITACLEWKRLGNRSERTLDTYERDLALLALAVPETDTAGVAEADLARVLQAVPVLSWGRVRKSWSVFFAWAIKHGRRQDNPVEMLPVLKAPPPPVYDLWRQDELDLLIASTRHHPEPLIQRLRVQTMIESGARASELTGIRLGDFDLSRKTVMLLGKGSKRRLVPVSGELTRLVDEYLLTPYPKLGREPVATDYVWFPIWRSGHTGEVSRVAPERRVDYRTFNLWWHRIVDVAGVRYRKPHMMRHTFATDVLDATEGDLYAVKELLGHSSTVVTEVYLHSSRTRTEAAVRALGDYRKAAR